MNCYAIGIDIFGIKRTFNIDPGNNLWCSHIDLISLTVYDKFNKIFSIYCYCNELEKLSIIGGKNIERLWCFKNNLKELDLSIQEKISDLYCDFELENNLKLSNNNSTKIIFI